MQASLFYSSSCTFAGCQRGAMFLGFLSSLDYSVLAVKQLTRLWFQALWSLLYLDAEPIKIRPPRVLQRIRLTCINI